MEKQEVIIRADYIDASGYRAANIQSNIEKWAERLLIVMDARVTWISYPITV